MEGNCKHLSKLYEWLGEDKKWCLCYGAVEDQWNVEEFHSKCDIYPHTVTIVRYGRNDIVGGYSDVAWSGEYYSLNQKIIFSLVLIVTRKLVQFSLDLDHCCCNICCIYSMIVDSIVQFT